MRAMLEALEARLEQQGNSGRPVIVGGDLNTHTFSRGTRFRAMKNTAIILNSNRRSLLRRLREPERKEPAIREFERFRYETADFNDRCPTSRTIVSNLDDLSGLPRPIQWWVSRRVGPEGLLLEFRLDWLAGRGVRALKAGELVDPATGVASIDPQTFGGLNHNEAALSDHDPIVADLAIE